MKDPDTSIKTSTLYKLIIDGTQMTVKKTKRRRANEKEKWSAQIKRGIILREKRGEEERDENSITLCQE